MKATLTYQCEDQTATFTVTVNGDGTSTMDMEFEPAIDDDTRDPTGLMTAAINAVRLLTGQNVMAD